MSVDSFKFLPKSFRPLFENADIQVDGPVWAPFGKPLGESRIAVLSSAGIFLRDTQESFDVEREKREPNWETRAGARFPAMSRKIGSTPRTFTSTRST